MASTESSSWRAEQYWTSRDFHTSARLHLQHWLFQSTIGSVLQPAIPVSNEGLRVADIACGNGAWLFDLARLLPSTSADLQGFDITASNFPAKPFLPKNVSLHVQDILGELPRRLVGAFDIVHMRAFASIVRNNDTSIILGNVAKMLKPGGWFQWDEAPPHLMTAMSPEEGVGKYGCEKLLGLLQMAGAAQGVKYDWFDDLPTRLQSHGFDAVEMKYFDNRSEQYKAWTEDYLNVYEGLADHLPPAEKAGPNVQLTREGYQALFNMVLEETNKGVVMHSQKLMVAVARKKN